MSKENVSDPKLRSHRKKYSKRPYFFYLIKINFIENDWKETTVRDMKKMDMEIEKKEFHSFKEAIDVNNLDLRNGWEKRMKNTLYDMKSVKNIGHHSSRFLKCVIY